jgi:outer membrane lipoprotein-sorting protein
MNLKYLLIALVFSLPLLGQDASAIVKQAEDKLRGEQSTSEVSMTIIRPNWERTIRMKSWSRGNAYSLILITSPARDQGTVYLKKQKEIYNWIPSIERNVKLPPSMMMQSWMGSDFTNDDLVRESSMVKDYEHKVLGEVEIDGRMCWQIELLPKLDAAVVWGKIILHIDQADYIQLRSEFYDEEGDLVNVMQGKKIEEIGGRTLATITIMKPVNEPGKMTILEYHTLDFETTVPREYFTTQYMKRVR